MALSDSTPVIAGDGHIYVAPPGTEVKIADLNKFKFNDGAELTGGWTWLGDHSSEDLPEFDSDGGDTTTKRTWDRRDLRVTREAKSHKITLSMVGITPDTIEAAFPGSSKDVGEKAWDVNLDGSVEKAVLIVVVDGDMVCAHLFRRVDMSGGLPGLDLEEFSKVEIAGAILPPGNGKTAYRYFAPRKVTSTD